MSNYPFYCEVMPLCSFAACFFPQVTIDANSYGLTSRKDVQMLKSGSSVELGPLYWQLEVGAVVTSEFECSGGKDNEQDVNDCREKRNMVFILTNLGKGFFPLPLSSNPGWKIQPSFSRAG